MIVIATLGIPLIALAFPAPVTQFLHSDILGSAQLATDQQGNPRVNQRLSGSSGPTKTFTGKELDDSGIYYFGARYYDPSLARFTQVDPVTLNLGQPSLESLSGGKSLVEVLADPRLLHPYSYAVNNPLRFIDDTGNNVYEYQPYYANGAPHNYNFVIGGYRGVEVRSAGADTGKGNHPFQCTTLVTDFTKNQYGVNLNNTGNGVAYGNQSRLNNTLQNNNPDHGSSSYVVYQNGSQYMPQEDDIISWSGGNYGHVGVVVEVSFDNQTGKGQVYTMEQNISTENGLFTQPLTRSYNVQGQVVYIVGNRVSSYQVQAWARYQNQTTLPSSAQYTRHTPITQPIKKYPY